MAVISSTCKLCGHTDRDLTVEQAAALQTDHVCKVAALLRRGAAIYRTRRSKYRDADLAVAEWLISCAGEADAMTGADDFGICDEPGSVRLALDVALAAIATEVRS